MRQIRGVRPCEIHDRVFGLKLPRIFPYTWPPANGYPGEDLASAVIVPAKRAPFTRSVGAVAAGEKPPDYESGFEIPLFPWRAPARDSRAVTLSSLTETFYGDADATCWGARATYIDDVQSHVHYIFTNQDDEGASVSVWNEIDLATQNNDVKWFRKRDYRDGGYGDYSQPNNFLGNNLGPEEMCRPNQWGVGLDYFVWSDYRGNQATYGGWTVVRWKREDGDYIVRDNFETFAGLDDLTKHTVLMPAPRTYRYSNIPANQPQEPWVIAHAPNVAGGQLVTGIWLNTFGHTEAEGFANPRAYLLGDEIKHILRNNWNGDVVCYNRIQQTDLVIATIDRTGPDGWEYYDGSDWQPTIGGEQPVWITKDWSGRLYYGDGTFIRKLPGDGDPGWRITASDTESAFRPSGYSEMFEILPTHRGIDLRHWLGKPADTTVQIGGTFGGVQFTFAPRVETKEAQYGHIFNWTFSFDGTILEPHVQDGPRYIFETFPGWDTAGSLVYQAIYERTDKRYLFGRSYSDRNPLEFGYIETVLFDNGGTLDPPLAAQIPWGSRPDFVHHGLGFDPLRSLPHGDANPDDEFSTTSYLPMTASKCHYDPVDTHGECEKSPLVQGY